MYAMMVDTRVKPGGVERYVEAMRLNQEGTRQEPGNIRFDLLVAPDDPHRFLVYEVYVNEAAVIAHRETAHYQSCVAAIASLMDGPREKQIYETVLVGAAAPTASGAEAPGASARGRPAV